METTHSNAQLCIFNKYYKRYYNLFAWRCQRAVKDDVVGSGMVQDAFLRVWLLRDQLMEDDIYIFLKRQLKQAIFAYYDTAKNRFNANLFRFDELENPDFLLQVNPDEEMDDPLGPIWQEDIEYQNQWAQLQQLIPNLSETQQQLIQLCIRYNFSYDRMAYYLGGISDYVVAKQVEVLLKKLKSILTEDYKLQEAGRKNSFTFDGSLDELQKNVMQMRYELQYSFEEIAKKLDIAEPQVKLAYARACRMCI
ncbi:hypothetical protein DU508_15295 [Pedobacter chinensis]|uniref:RNA polymerase sigma factor 70 region 4 type 2 domain-containing protein n=1 Tax=Pedobacter chinensis TaxID=2282421 RepID=A0A369PSL6_9SPHI|nr:sigma factor-like helix-turn-helix DNA-binding protein [Pedobacter chinensis]RDC55641.1 hypothetical protein DU508_15295 [Pedobacter chinensis]